MILVYLELLLFPNKIGNINARVTNTEKIKSTCSRFRSFSHKDRISLTPRKPTTQKATFSKIGCFSINRTNAVAANRIAIIPIKTPR